MSKRMKMRLVRWGIVLVAVMMFGPAVWAMVKSAAVAAVLVVAPIATALYVFPATRPMVVRYGLLVSRGVLREGKRWGRKGVRALVR